MAKCQNPDCDYFQKPIPDGDFCPFCGQEVQLRTQLAVTQLAVTQLAVTLPSSEIVEMEIEGVEIEGVEIEGVEIEGVEMEPIHLEDLTQDPIPGEIILAETPILANVGRRTLILEVTNTGDRPVQVGSHYHFFEVNRGLLFDRADSFGMRLNIPSGNAVRFEPGQTQRVTLVELSGKGVVYGFNSLTQGSTRTRAQHLKAMQSYQNWQEGSIAPEVIV